MVNRTGNDRQDRVAALDGDGVATRAVERGWDGRAYAEAAGHHRALDDWFLERHRPAPGDRVVDVGCGSGEFTARLAALVPSGSVLGVEPDPSMVEAARRREAPNLAFVRAPAQELDEVVPAASVDLVVSRAAFHWIPLADQLRCYEAVRNVLRPGGTFHAESGGAGNVARFVAVTDSVAEALGSPPAATTFMDAATAFELLEDAGFTPGPDAVRTVAQRRPFTREQLLAMVRTQAVNGYRLDEDQRDRFVAGVERRADELRRSDGTFDQTFVRLEVLVTR
jgi:trans-aconitate methyltransferase